MKERWDAITTEYTKKGTFAQTDLCTRFLKSKCPEKGNIQQFLDELCIKREELATVGVDVDKKDYCSTIISSLPIPLANFTSNQLAFAKIYSPTKMIAPNLLISLISEEYECQHAQHTCQGGPGKAIDEDRDEALAVVPEKSKGKECKPHGVCWNCGEKGHFKNKCPKPAVKKDNSPKKTGTANTVVESDSNAEGAFFMEDSDSDDPDMPDLQDVSDSESDDEGSV